MPTYTIERTKEKIEINDTHFKAKGGEGSVFIIGDTVYKICEDGKMIPQKKFKELSVLNHPNIIVPQETILYRNKPVGYTMKAVPNNPYPLVQILTKTFREREGVKPDQMMDLVKKLYGIVKFVHKHDGYLQIDGNERNYMVTSSFNEIYAIDTNSYQTPNFPAEVIMPSIRDWHVKKDAKGIYLFSQSSDWYSFAILSFYMFTGIHPFKGSHPANTNMKTKLYDNMLGCKSVLDKDVSFPTGAVYSPFEDYIPGGKDGAYMQWYKAVFVNNKRMPAPEHWQSILTFVPKIKEIIGSNNFEITELSQFASQITAFYSKKNREVVVTKEKIHIGGLQIDHPHERFRIGFTQKGNVPYAAWLKDGILNLLNLNTQNPIKANTQGNYLMSYDGRIYIQSNANILELDFIESGETLISTSKSVATILPNATQMMQGVVIQDMFGTYVASMFPLSGHHRQIRLDKIKNYLITEAKYENQVLMIVAIHKETGQHDRFIYRFSQDWSNHDLRKIENISPVGINFTVLDSGIVINITEDEKIELFSSKPERPEVKSVDDPVIQSDMRLCHLENEARFARNSKLYKFKLK